MRLQSYLVEDIEYEKDLILGVIKSMEMMLPEEAVKAAGKLTTPEILFRGMETKHVDKGVGTVTPRIDRKPTDTDSSTHWRLDKYFFKEFGWKARSEGMFCTPSLPRASSFARARGNKLKDIYIVIPSTPYKYIWSPKVPDLYDFIAEYQENVSSHDDYDDERGGDMVGSLIHDIDIDSLEDVLDKQGYISKGLEKNKGIDGKEVMIKCTTYKALHYLYYPWVCEANGITPNRTYMGWMKARNGV
jgi:hypothetical protein